MNLPHDIKSQVAEYLTLEFGSNDITENHLEYLGSKNELHYWTLSKSGKSYWATVEPYEDSYIIGMTTSKPHLD